MDSNLRWWELLQSNLKHILSANSSFQRGSNENLNSIVRRWFKKGFDFTFLDDKKVLNLQWKINHIPRKIFRFKLSLDIYSQYNL